MSALSSAATSAAATPAVHAKGTRVYAKAVDTWKKAYLGTIVRSITTDSGSPLYDIAFDDGERHEAVAAANVTLWTRTYSSAAAAAATVGASKSAKGKTYTAPDGKTFDDRRAYRKHLKEVVFSLSGREGEVLYRGRNGIKISGQNMNLKNLEKCTVLLLDNMAQVLVDGIRDSHIFIGPTESSVFLRNCERCVFTVACRQLRTRDLTDCTLNLFSCVDPVIERSTGLTLRPFNGTYPGIASDFAAAGLDPRDNHWRLVFDFNPNGDDGYGVPDPHYSLEEGFFGEWRMTSPNGDEEDEPVPVAVDAVAITESDGGVTHAGQPHSKAAAAAAAPRPGSAAGGNGKAWGWTGDCGTEDRDVDMEPNEDDADSAVGFEEIATGSVASRRATFEHERTDSAVSAREKIQAGSVAQRCATFEKLNDNACVAKKKEEEVEKFLQEKKKEKREKETTTKEKNDGGQIGLETDTPYGKAVVKDVRVEAEAGGCELRTEVSSLSFGTLYSPKRERVRPSQIKAIVKGATAAAAAAAAAVATVAADVCEDDVALEPTRTTQEA